MKKQIHFDVPLALWEAFYKLFPGKGERSSFFRAMIKEAITLGETQPKQARKLINIILDKEDL